MHSKNSQNRDHYENHDNQNQQWYVDTCINRVIFSQTIVVNLIRSVLFKSFSRMIQYCLLDVVVYNLCTPSMYRQHNELLDIM